MIRRNNLTSLQPVPLQLGEAGVRVQQRRMEATIAKNVAEILET